MKKTALFLLILTLCCGVYAQQPQCAGGHAGCSSLDKACCAGKAKMESLSVEAFAKRIEASKVVVVDVRTAKEFAEGHLKGALNVVWDKDFEAHVQAARLCPHKTVALYCRSGRRSKAAAEALVKMGYQVVELDKGIVGWQQAGFPVEK